MQDILKRTFALGFRTGTFAGLDVFVLVIVIYSVRA
jgi:hypothetical protein